MALWQAQPTHLGRKLLHHFLLGVDVRSIWPCSLSLEFIGLNQAAAPFVMKPASRFPSVHRKQKTEGWETQRVGKFQFSVRLVLSPTIERTPSLHPIHHATHWHVCHHCGGSQYVFFVLYNGKSNKVSIFWKLPSFAMQLGRFKDSIPAPIHVCHLKQSK